MFSAIATFSTSILVFAAGILGQNAGEQDRVRATRARLDHVRLFDLEHARSMELAHILSEILQGPYAHGEERSNTLIYSGPQELLDVVEKLVFRLDAGTKPSRDELELVMVAVKNRDVMELAEQLSNAFAGLPLRVAPDRGRSVLVLRGPKEVVSRAEEVIEKLDTPAPTAFLEFTYFKASLEEDSAQSAPIAEDLREVVQALKRFGRIELVGRLFTVAEEGRSFAIKGDIASEAYAQIRGRLLSAAKEGGVKIKINASLELQKPAAEAAAREGKPRSQARETGFHLETTLSTARGDYLILGSAPNGWKSGESAILVLQVRP